MTHTGKLHNLVRLPSSANGNPRYRFMVGANEYRTSPDSDLAYGITNYDGQNVTVEAQILRNYATVTSIYATVTSIGESCHCFGKGKS